MNQCTAVLLDTVSIQDYIFQSNQLKENIGASFLVKGIYKTCLKNAIESVTKKEVDLDLWKKEPDVIRINTDTERFEVGFIGGGNALLLFRRDDHAEQFIKTWTTNLLRYAPGITTAVAFHNKFAYNDEHFYDSKKELFRQLRKNKGMYIPDTLIPAHGITVECRHSGLSANIVICNPEKEFEYISASTYAKIEAVKEEQKKIRDQYLDILGNDFEFTDDIGNLGQKGGEDSHIAIVHIDGNDMGSRFKKTQSLAEIRKLSVSVENATQTAFRCLLKHIKENKQKFQNAKEFNLFKTDGTLPIRSIVLGGDDVTFVCDGRLGLYFAKTFIEAFQDQKVNGKKDLTACAGVAIIKTKYPFSRGYKLAEELCKNAKDVRHEREKGNGGSYLDFHLATGGFTGTLGDIRKKQFQVAQGSLLYRPYKLVPTEQFDEYSFDLLLQKATELQPPRFPKNKLYELREVLTLSKDATERFMQEITFRGLELPQIKGQYYHTKLIDNQKTPYFDMIELLELYPQFALKELEGDE